MIEVFLVVYLIQELSVLSRIFSKHRECIWKKLTSQEKNNIWCLGGLNGYHHFWEIPWLMKNITGNRTDLFCSPSSAGKSLTHNLTRMVPLSPFPGISHLAHAKAQGDISYRPACGMRLSLRQTEIHFTL